MKNIYSLLLLSSLTLPACTTVMNNLPGVYTLDIQQGNIINQETIDQLRPKMTKRQVLYVMGSSMLTDVFHQQRWDYIYSEQLAGGVRQQKRISLFFDGDELMGVQGDFKPSTLPVASVSNETTLELPPRNLEKTLWQKITYLLGSEEITNRSNETNSRTSQSIPNSSLGNDSVFPDD